MTPYEQRFVDFITTEYTAKALAAELVTLNGDLRNLYDMEKVNFKETYFLPENENYDDKD